MQMSGRFDQQELALLLAESPHVDEPGPIRDRREHSQTGKPDRARNGPREFSTSRRIAHRKSWLRVNWLIATTKAA